VSKFRSASASRIATLALGAVATLATLGGCAVVPGVHVFPPRVVISAPRHLFITRPPIDTDTAAVGITAVIVGMGMGTADTVKDAVLKQSKKADQHVVWEPSTGSHKNAFCKPLQRRARDLESRHAAKVNRFWVYRFTLHQASDVGSAAAA
jgi:hypothetical protein